MIELAFWAAHPADLQLGTGLRQDAFGEEKSEIATPAVDATEWAKHGQQQQNIYNFATRQAQNVLAATEGAVIRAH
jgi:hypothetical protein